MQLSLLLLLLLTPALCLDHQDLIEAFSDVFEMKDLMTNPTEPVYQEAWRQLDHIGVPRDLQSLCNLTDPVLVQVLMRAALGNLIQGLRDPSDWSIIVADVGTGKLVRRRSFSSTRLAVIESLLLIAIVALGRTVWIRNI